MTNEIRVWTLDCFENEQAKEGHTIAVYSSEEAANAAHKRMMDKRAENSVLYYSTRSYIVDNPQDRY